MVKGVILKGVGGLYSVYTENKTVTCRARGRFRQSGTIPLVGDYVLVNKQGDQDEGVIEKILPRKNKLIRPAVANIDYLAIVIAATDPEPDLVLVDKLMICCDRMDIQPMLVINKSDLTSDDELNSLISSYGNTGCPIYKVSCKTGNGIDDLINDFKDGIIAVAGQSGVGKSSLINRLQPKLNLQVGDISKKIGRGKHTTRHVELFSLSSGAMMVDTPGFNILELQSIDPFELHLCYPDFKPYIDNCRFRDCMHMHEPDCEVRDKVAEGLIDKGRYERYIKILEEIREKWRGYDD